MKTTIDYRATITIIDDEEMDKHYPDFDIDGWPEDHPFLMRARGIIHQQYSILPEYVSFDDHEVVNDKNIYIFVAEY